MDDIDTARRPPTIKRSRLNEAPAPESPAVGRTTARSGKKQRSGVVVAGLGDVVSDAWQRRTTPGHFALHASTHLFRFVDRCPDIEFA